MRKQGQKTIKNSEQIINNSRRNKFGEIFDKIANNGSAVSAINIDLNQIDPKTRQILKPLLDFIQRQTLPTNKDEFVQLGLSLYPVSNFILFFIQNFYIEPCSK